MRDEIGTNFQRLHCGAQTDTTVLSYRSVLKLTLTFGIFSDFHGNEKKVVKKSRPWKKQLVLKSGGIL